VNEALIHLYELQKIDKQLDELRENRGELPERVEEMRQSVVTQRDLLGQAQAHVEQLETRSRLIQSDSLEYHDKVEKYKAQQFEVKTTREYDAITFQLEDGQKRLSKNIEDASRIGIELEQTKADTKNIKEDLDAMELELKEQEAALKEVMAETEEEEAALRKERAKTVKLVVPQHLANYERVRPAKNGVAVVAVKNGVCGGCFNAMPRQLVIELKRGDKFAVCEYCGRIVVGEPVAIAVDGEPIVVEVAVEAPAPAKKRATRAKAVPE
jgi:predicted  nucleic acid-binding Zn-ribbon protein